MYVLGFFMYRHDFARTLPAPSSFSYLPLACVIYGTIDYAAGGSVSDYRPVYAPCACSIVPPTGCPARDRVGHDGSEMCRAEWRRGGEGERRSFVKAIYPPVYLQSVVITSKCINERWFFKACMYIFSLQSMVLSKYVPTSMTK